MASDTLFQTVQLFDGHPISPEEAAKYLGCQMEALGKKAELISPVMGNWLRQYGLMFRGGECDHVMRAALAREGMAAKLLALDVETVWFTVAAARATNADFVAAYCIFLDRCRAPKFGGQPYLDYTSCIK